jgi:lipoate-protein ligase A
VKGKKISGSAQARKSRTILHHGTLLIDVDLERMFSIIQVPWAKSLEEIVGVAQKKITSAKNELGHPVTISTAANAVTVGFRNSLKIALETGELTTFEEKTADRLYEQKYSTNDWNLNGKSIIG